MSYWAAVYGLVLRSGYVERCWGLARPPLHPHAGPTPEGPEQSPGYKSLGAATDPPPGFHFHSTFHPQEKDFARLSI